MTRRTSMPAARGPIAALTLALAAWLFVSPAWAQPDAPRATSYRSFYFDTLGYTETWLDLTPPPADGDAASPITLNLTVRYRGRPIEAPLNELPLAIVVRAESNPQYRPTFLRQPILMIDADGEGLWDPGLRVQFYSRNAQPCEGCTTSADIVEVTIPQDALRRMSAARTLRGNAFGLSFALSAAQAAAIRAFVVHVLGEG